MIANATTLHIGSLTTELLITNAIPSANINIDNAINILPVPDSELTVNKQKEIAPIIYAKSDNKLFLYFFMHILYQTYVLGGKESDLHKQLQRLLSYR